MRVATVNLLHGRSIVDGIVDSERMATAVAELDADVVGLQEVDHHQLRSGQANQTDIIASAMGRRSTTSFSYRFAPAILGVPGGRWTPAKPTDPLGGNGVGDDEPAEQQGPSYGISLVTRLAVESWHVVELRHAPVKSPILLPGSKRPILLADEPRRAIAAVLEPGCGPFRTVATTHLSFVPGWNVRQLRHLLRSLAHLPGPRLLLGDLNLPAAVIRRVTQWNSLVSEPTFPGPDPKIQFDHLLTDHPSIRPVRSHVPLLAISDHRAVVADFDPIAY